MSGKARKIGVGVGQIGLSWAGRIIVSYDKVYSEVPS